MDKISRRMVFAGAGGVAAIALTGCAANGTTNPIVVTLANGVVTALNALKNGLSSALAAITTITGSTPLSAQAVAQVQLWINFLDQLAGDIQNAINSTAQTAGTDIATYIKKAEVYLNDIVGMLAPLAQLVPVIGTALTYAGVVLPFLEEAVNYLVGLLTTPPSLTTPTTPAATASLKARFGGRLHKVGAAPMGTTPAQAIAALNALAATP